jgi:hypothetical protein
MKETPPKMACATNVVPGIDVRADGGYIIVPSPNSPGREWIIGDPFDDGDLCEAAPWVVELMRNERRELINYPPLPDYNLDGSPLGVAIDLPGSLSEVAAGPDASGNLKQPPPEPPPGSPATARRPTAGGWCPARW